MAKPNTTNDVSALLEAIEKGEAFGISPFNILISKGKLIEILEGIVDSTLSEIGQLAEDMLKGGIDKETEDIQELIDEILSKSNNEEGVKHLKNITYVYGIQSTRALYFKLVMTFITLLMDRILVNDDSYLVGIHLKSRGIDKLETDDRMFG